MSHRSTHFRNRWQARFGIAAALMLMVQLPGLILASAQTSSTTGVTVNVVDAGIFRVDLAAEGITFATVDGSAPGITAFSGATVYATLPISLTDTRSDETRAGYIVRLRMDALTLGDDSLQSMTIDSANIRVASLSGLPSALVQGFGSEAYLDAPVNLFGADGAAPAVKGDTVSVTLMMEIPAGTMPGEFSGEISLEVIPGGIS